jgi:hypothetical protein
MEPEASRSALLQYLPSEFLKYALMPLVLIGTPSSRNAEF